MLVLIGTNLLKVSPVAFDALLTCPRTYSLRNFIPVFIVKLNGAQKFIMLFRSPFDRCCPFLCPNYIWKFVEIKDIVLLVCLITYFLILYPLNKPSTVISDLISTLCVDHLLYFTPVFTMLGNCNNEISMIDGGPRVFLFTIGVLKKFQQIDTFDTELLS